MYHYNMQLTVVVVVVVETVFVLLLLIQLVGSLPKPIHLEVPSKFSGERGSNDGLSHIQGLEILSQH